MANFSISTKKILSASNIKRIIMLGVSLRDKMDNISKGLISEYDSTKTYTNGMSVYYDDYLYECIYTTTGDFDSSKWSRKGDILELITKQDIEAMLGLTTEELQTLSSIILDSEIRLDKTHSSSKIFSDMQDILSQSKTFTLQQFAKASKASYQVVSATSEMTDKSVIYLMPNNTNYDMYIVEESGTPTKIGDTTIDLSQFYTKEQIDNYFLKKTDADGKYATQTSFNSHTSDTDIHTSATEKASYVKKTDIVDNLTSTETDKPLSANQGRLLNSMIVTLTGVVLPYAGSSVPDGFLLCNGQAVSRTEYLDLFSVIGTTYGEGDGSTTFNLPNLQNKFIQGTGTNAVGTEMSAGLPNIWGEFGYIKSLNTGNYYQAINVSNGCFKSSRSITTDPPSAIATKFEELDTKSRTGVIVLNASNSSSIYGNSNTVQPPAVVMNYIIKY